MKTEIEVLRKLVALYDAGLRPQIILGMHREELEFHDCVMRARLLVKRSEARQAREDYAHRCAMEDAFPDGQGA